MATENRPKASRPKKMSVKDNGYSQHLADFLATNPFHTVTFGRTVDLVNNPEKIPDWAEWMTNVVRASLAWEPETK